MAAQLYPTERKRGVCCSNILIQVMHDQFPHLAERDISHPSGFKSRGLIEGSQLGAVAFTPHDCLLSTLWQGYYDFMCSLFKTNVNGSDLGVFSLLSLSIFNQKTNQLTQMFKTESPC